MANFEQFLPLLKKNEGGWQELKNDTGNYTKGGVLVGTNHGISTRLYETIIGRPPTKADMKAITWNEAVRIYRKYFWDVMKGDRIKNQSVAEIIIDHGVNAGVSAATKLLQRVLNNKFGKSLKIDGSFGEKTLEALHSVNQEQLHKAYKKAREDFYKSLGNNEFQKGWLIRANRFFFSIGEFAGKNKGSITGVLFVTAIVGFIVYKQIKKRKPIKIK
ncbi:MAG: glycosyl hydrolase 108 family protein [Capnocytophaga sp.]|nr:glycosyl hydrolase 108 family protein [Capnocytophaga sp.]